jgi:hypothetical protein
MILNQ